jgi:hypothetical protein
MPVIVGATFGGDDDELVARAAVDQAGAAQDRREWLALLENAGGQGSRVSPGGAQ